MKKIPCLCILLTSLLVSGSATACTGFMSSDDQQVLLGNNEDWLYPEAYLWLEPPFPFLCRIIHRIRALLEQ